MSAKLELITHLIPKSNKAQGACSRDDPHPKFFPANKIFEAIKPTIEEMFTLWVFILIILLQ